jgi:predicted nucleic acid-binding Zn ribbon protein
MTRKPKSVRHLLKSKPNLRRLELEISAHKVLLDRVRQALPADLAGHCIFAQLHGSRLLVHVDSPAWATRLRFMAPQLAGVIGGERPPTEVRVRLLVDNARRSPRPTPARRSDYAADVVADSAIGVEDRELQEALLRLGRRLRTR